MEVHTPSRNDDENFFGEHVPAPESPAETIERLSKLTPVQYEQIRTAEAEKLNFRTSVLDEEVRRVRGGAAEPTHGRRLVLKPPEPWDDPVDLITVLEELATAIDRHVILSPAARDAVVLWIAHSWVYTRFQHTPRLAITSPEKRCGKSTLLDILRATCRTPLKADNISASSVFRTIESLAPLTLLVDEADSFLADNEELRGVLNSGFESSGMVIRVVEIQGEHQPVQFATFSPVALAAIGKLPGTLEDRAIPIRLERKAAKQTVVKMRAPGARNGLYDLSRKLIRWAKDSAEKLDANPAIPSALNDREGDISVPLLSIADAAGQPWAKRCRDAILSVFGQRAEDDDAAGTGAMLLADIRDLFNENGAERIPSATMAARLAAMEHRPWAEWKNGKPMSAAQLARQLGHFRIRPATMRVLGQEGTPKGYQRDHFIDTWDRYCPLPSTTGLSNRNTATLKEITRYVGKTETETQNLCCGSEITEDTEKTINVAVLRFEEGDIGSAGPSTAIKGGFI